MENSYLQKFYQDIIYLKIFQNCNTEFEKTADSYLQYLLKPPLQRPAQLVEISISTWHSLAILTAYIHYFIYSDIDLHIDLFTGLMYG